MRAFNNFEKDILKFMVNHPEPQDECTITLFSKFCDCYYIRWSDDYKTLDFAFKKGKDGFKVREKIFDTVVLLQYLESNYLIGIFSADLLKDNQIYDKNKYEVSGEEWSTIKIVEKRTLNIVPVQIGTIKLGGAYNTKSLLTTSIHHEKTGIGEQIEKYANSTYHSTQTLKDFVANGFQTEEDLRYKRTERQGWCGIILALLIGIAGLITDFILNGSKVFLNLIFNFFSSTRH